MRPLPDRIARVAARQHGRITVAQVLELGASRGQIKRWIAAGWLRRVHHGVMAVGHEAPSPLADLMAAVLAAGTGAVVSHGSAAYLLRLAKTQPPLPELTVPVRSGRRRPGLVIHRVRQLPALDLSRHEGIAVTTVPRVLLDLAPRTTSDALTDLCHEAWARHRTGRREVEACLARNPHKKGAAKLRLALAGDATLSPLEKGFRALLRGAGLPLPRTNIDHKGDKVDCHWPALGLTVELHSYRFHASRRGFETDLARRRRSRHIAFSWGDVFERPAATLIEVEALLVEHGWSGRRKVA